MREICHHYAVEFYDSKLEPIPSFDTHNSQMLQSALAQPQQTFGKKDLYPTIEQKAAVLFYSLVKNHPFQNGNKRIAYVAFSQFLYINKLDIKAFDEDIYNLAVDVANSKPKERDRIINNLVKWIEKRIIWESPFKD